MIIEYPSRPAKCKDCIYCGYYYPLKKDGSESYVRRHKCKLTGSIILLSDCVCDKWKMGCGVPSNYDYETFKKMINLNELRDRAYKCACDHGFHDKRCSDAHYLMLVITKLSEAVEADRKGRYCTKNGLFVPNRKAFEIRSKDDGFNFKTDFEELIKDSVEDELADTVIRLLDLAGHLKIDIDLNDKLPKYSKVCFDSFGSFADIAYKACNWLTNNEFEQEKWVINGAIWFIFLWCEYLNIDLVWHIEQNMKYNELRPKMHGKKY